MKQTFEYGRYSYEYYIEFAPRKTLALEVLPDLRIITKVPLDATLDEIERFLTRKWKWLEKQQSELGKLSKVRTEKQYVSGESFYYLGRQYLLLVRSGSEDSVKLDRSKLQICTIKDVRNSEYNRQLLESWYDRRRNVIFKQEYLQASTLFQLSWLPQFGERAMSRRWGSYTSDRKILLNPRLIEAPREAIRYVCVHELCHTISRKHDTVFYDALNQRLPGWRRIKDSLEIRHG